tara:strand:+ start:434 stop:736 length:303 start_codon:yes stop_codon:yes gene_type:complete
MRRTGYYAAVAVSWIGVAASADFSQSQLVALTVLFPLAQEQLDRTNAQALVECMVLAAKAEEASRIAAFAGMAPSPVIIDLANEIIQRPAVLSCLTEKLS